MNNWLWITGAVGAVLTFFGPAIVRYVTAAVQPNDSCFPADDIETIERLMHLRTTDIRFSEDGTAVESINYIIEVLTGTAE